MPMIRWYAVAGLSAIRSAGEISSGYPPGMTTPTGISVVGRPASTLAITRYESSSACTEGK